MTLTFYHGWSPPDNTKLPDTGKCVMTFLWLSSMIVWLKKTERSSSFYHILLFYCFKVLETEKNDRTIQMIANLTHFVVLLRDHVWRCGIWGMIDFAWLISLYGRCVWFTVSLEGVGELKWAGLATSRVRSRRRRAERIVFFYFSSLSKGYWDSYKKGSMLGKCYRAATSISNGIFKPLNLSLNGSCEWMTSAWPWYLWMVR